MGLRCLKCGEDRLLTVEASPGVALVFCNVCSFSSFFRACVACLELGSHKDGCLNDTPWAV